MTTASLALNSGMMTMRKKSIVDIFKDEEQLSEYILSLEDDIAKSEVVDDKVNELLDNLLYMFNDFNDKRALRASNIEAITNLLKLKADLPMQRVKIKKTALDILTKKKELEIKDKAATAVGNIAMSSGELLRSIYLKLDQYSIHPEIANNEILEAECCEIIEKPKELVAISKISEKEEIDTQVVDIAKLQQTLDSHESEEEVDD